MSELNPIFVHASPRSGSTYFFNVLRRNRSLTCFNEAINDVFSHYGKHDIARFKAAQKWNVNHHFLERDDFDELIAAWDVVAHLYPPFPSFQDYLPTNGILPTALRAYLAGLMQYACSSGKQPALCEIHSRGRAAALRHAFGGFHIAQYRDPLSQFGSFFLAVAEAGEWGFLTFPLMELGISGEHPLYRLVPQTWRVSVLPWPADDRAVRWSSAMQYISMVASPHPDTIVKAFRWYLFSWFLSNLAALSYSDFALDIDKTYDDHAYRRIVIDVLSSKCGVAVDFGDLAKFSRYYEFDSLDVAAVCDQVTSAIKDALRSGRVDDAVRALGARPPILPTAAGVEILLAKVDQSLTSMAASADRRRITEQDWKALAAKYRKIWFHPGVRVVAQRVYPLAAPIARAARRAGFAV